MQYNVRVKVINKKVQYNNKNYVKLYENYKNYKK